MSVVRFLWLCVMIGTPSGHRSSSGCSFMMSSRTVSIAHGHAVMPTTSTPIDRSMSPSPRRAFARATSSYGSSEVRPHGEVRSRKYAALAQTSEVVAYSCRLSSERAIVSVSSSRLPTGSRTERSTTSLIASRFRDRCEPFWFGGRSTKTSSVVVSVTERFGRRTWTGFTTPVTPTLFSRYVVCTRSFCTSFGMVRPRPPYGPVGLKLAGLDLQRLPLAPPEVVRDHGCAVPVFDDERDPDADDPPREDESKDERQGQPDPVDPAEGRHEREARVPRSPKRAVDREERADRGDAHGVDPDERHRIRDDARIADEHPRDRLREREDPEADEPRDNDGEFRGLPPAPFRVLRLVRAEVLSDEGRRRDREPKAGHEREALDAQPDLVRRQDGGAEDDDHADPHEERDLQEDLLERRGPPDPKDAADRVHVDPWAAEVEFQTVLPSEEDRDEDQGPDDVRDRRADGGAGDAEARDERVAVDQVHVDPEVHDVHEDPDPEGRHSVARAPERCVPEEADELEEHDERDDARVRGPERDDIGCRAETGEDRLREDEPHEGERDRHDRAENEALLQDVVRLVDVVPADRARDEGDRPRAHADHDREEEEDELPSEAHGSHGRGRLGAEGAHHDHIDRGREGLQEVRDHHGPCEAEHGDAGRARRGGRGGHAAVVTPLAIWPLACRRPHEVARPAKERGREGRVPLRGLARCPRGWAFGWGGGFT